MAKSKNHFIKQAVNCIKTEKFNRKWDNCFENGEAISNAIINHIIELCKTSIIWCYQIKDCRYYMPLQVVEFAENRIEQCRLDNLRIIANM